MKKFIKRIKKKPILISTIIFFSLFLFSSIFLIYSILKIANIENLLRYLISIILVLVIIYFLLETIKVIFKAKKPLIIVMDVLFILLFLITSYACTTINNIYGGISNIYKESTTYEVNAIVKTNSNINSVSDIENNTIGMLSKESQKEINEISSELINDNKLETKNKIKEYDSSNEMINALYNDEIDVALIESNYVSIYSSIDAFKNISSETKVIGKKDKKIKKENEENVKDKTEPFTILILGMDSTIKDISTVTSFNADSIMLITFNPKTYNTTILSIPRDTYVPISCSNNLESKITHSGWGGESCVISTLENWMDIKIDYYVKVNFTAVVNLVDAIGGIEVDVPYSFCEQNSNREWGENTVYVKKGLQTLNGEQALALSRNRHPNPNHCSEEWTNYYSDDIIRGQNQQLVLSALINKITKNLNMENVNSILNIIGTNVDTNMKINEITNYYSVVKDIAINTLNENGNGNAINFERLQLSTYGKSLYDPLLNLSGMSMQIYYKESFKQIVNEMKINLGLLEPTIIKSFSFSVNNPYKEKIVGTGVFNQDDIQTVPNFVGSNKSVVENWAYENNIQLIIEYEESNQISNDQVISQSIRPTYRIDKISEPLKIVVSIYTQEDNYENQNEDDENTIENDENSIIEDFLP